MSRSVAMLVMVVAAAMAAPVSAIAAEADDLYRQAQDHERGNGVARDRNKALSLYCRAAKAGSWKAAYEIGWMHLGDIGALQDGIVWLDIAPDAGFAPAGRLARLTRPTDPTARPRCAPRGSAVATRRLPSPPQEYIDIVNEFAVGLDLDPRLVIAMMAVESSYRPKVVSPKGAQGLMQLIPATAARFGVSDPFNPRQNIKGGMKYLRWLLDHFSGNLSFALAGYNAGENAVKKYAGIPPYDETQAYVRKVLALYDRKQLAGTSDGGAVASLWRGAPAVTKRRSSGCYEVSAGGSVRPC